VLTLARHIAAMTAALWRRRCFRLRCVRDAGFGAEIVVRMRAALCAMPWHGRRRFGVFCAAHAEKSSRVIQPKPEQNRPRMRKDCVQQSALCVISTGFFFDVGVMRGGVSSANPR
jgi:hypothetical protein